MLGSRWCRDGTRHPRQSAIDRSTLHSARRHRATTFGRWAPAVGAVGPRDAGSFGDPEKQVLAVVTGPDRADFTTHQARAVLRRVGFGVHRRSDHVVPGVAGHPGPRGGAEAALLRAHLGPWVAQDGLGIVFAAQDVQTVLGWLHRHGRRAGSGGCRPAHKRLGLHFPRRDRALHGVAGRGGRLGTLGADVAIEDMDGVLVPCLVDSGAVHTVLPS